MCVICIVPDNRRIVDCGVMAMGMMATLTATKKLATGLMAAKGPSRAALANEKVVVKLDKVTEGMSF